MTFYIWLFSQDYGHWDVIDSLPSYGRGLEVPGRRYRSLISGQNLTDVVITGSKNSIPPTDFWTFFLVLTILHCNFVFTFYFRK